MSSIAPTLGQLINDLFEEYLRALGDKELATLATASSTNLMFADDQSRRPLATKEISSGIMDPLEERTGWHW